MTFESLVTLHIVRIFVQIKVHNHDSSKHFRFQERYKILP